MTYYLKLISIFITNVFKSWPIIIIFFSVVIQKYEIRLFDEFVLRGNIAVLRCPIPSSVTDYVKVISWERIDGFMITENSGNGKNLCPFYIT